MPIYLFTCPNDHTLEKFKPTPYKQVRRYRCKECGLWMNRDYVKEHQIRKKEIHLDYEKDPISHLSKKRSFKGIWIENLTPTPVRVESEAQYHKLLKDTNSREKVG